MVIKKKRYDWLNASRAKRLVQLTNLKDKIGDFETVLPFPKQKKDRVILCCETYIALANYIEQTRATAQQLTDYEDLICQAMKGNQGDPAPAFGGFKTLTLPAGAFVGIIFELRELVDDIKHADNYTRAIGEDLMIVPPEGEDRDPDSIVAEIKPRAIGGTYNVRIEGSLQGATAMRLDWRRKGATAWQKGVGYLTKLPGEIEIEPTVAGEPESGELRAVLIENNEEIGQPSPNYPLTVG